MDTDKIFQSKLLKGIMLGIVGLIILAFVFGLGVFVGAKKADFSFKWAAEYHRNFGGPQGGFFGNFLGLGDEFANANGVFGQVIKIDSSSLTVKDKDNVEKIVLVSNKTSIIYQKKNIKLSDLKTSDSIIAIGDPNDKGQIQAELIRVVPPPPVSPTKNTSVNNQTTIPN